MSTIFGDTTVVTEARTYLVDKRGRKSMGRAAVSARSPNVSQQSVTVTRTQSHTVVKHANKHLQIKSDFPLRALFVQGTPEPEHEQPKGKQFTTAVIYSDEIKLNYDHQIVVFEPDITAESIQVTVFNGTTGETETLDLTLISPGMYRGHIAVQASARVGTNFDKCLYADYGHHVKIIYNDGRASNGEPAVVVKTVGIERAAALPELIVRGFATTASTVGVILRTILDSALVTVVNRRTNYSLQVPLGRDTGGMSGSFLVSSFPGGIEDDDILETKYVWTDAFGVPQDIVAITKIVPIYPRGIVNVADAAHGQPVPIRINDSELVGTTVGIVIVDLDTSDFERIRLDRVGVATGVYEASYMPPRNARRLEVRYTNDTVVTKRFTVAEPVEVEPEEPVPEPTEPTPVVASQIEMVINGLFVLNGQFSGTIKLTAFEDESVSCSIIHAS